MKSTRTVLFLPVVALALVFSAGACIRFIPHALVELVPILQVIAQVIRVVGEYSAEADHRLTRPARCGARPRRPQLRQPQEP